MIYCLLITNVMTTYLVLVSIMIAAVILPLFIPAKKRKNGIRIPKNYRDISDANYAINENGFLERIHHDKFSNHA